MDPTEWANPVSVHQVSVKVLSHAGLSHASWLLMILMSQSDVKHWCSQLQFKVTQTDSVLIICQVSNCCHSATFSVLELKLYVKNDASLYFTF